MPPQTVLILKADRLLADGICRAAHEVWPAATYYLETSVAGARQLLATRRIDALLTGLGMLDGDACRFVGDCAWQAGGRPLITVITGRRDPPDVGVARSAPDWRRVSFAMGPIPRSLLRLGWWNGSWHGNHGRHQSRFCITRGTGRISVSCRVV